MTAVLIGCALVSVVERELQRMLAAQLRDWIDIEIGLRTLHHFCDGCDCSRAQCDRYVASGCIACCPDCVHRWVVQP